VKINGESAAPSFMSFVPFMLFLFRLLESLSPRGIVSGGDASDEPAPIASPAAANIFRDQP
jgi:hypothetical protein